MMDNIGVLVATVIMVVLALVIILLKVESEEIVKYEEERKPFSVVAKV